MKTEYWKRFDNRQSECKYAKLNKKGFCDHNLWANDGLCHCSKKEFDGRKVTAYLCCPYLFRNDV